MLRFPVEDPYDAAGEFFRWEIAVPAACHILGVNAFDQPDVQESKDRTKAKIAAYKKSGRLDEGSWDIDLANARNEDVISQRLEDFIHQARPGNYFAVNAYLPRNADMIAALQRVRISIREQTHCAVAADFGPRFQHSTGQFHKGGPDTGLFIQVVCNPEKDIEIPNEGMTFGMLIRAQALGDYETLQARGRRVLRVHLSKPQDINTLVQLLEQATARERQR